MSELQHAASDPLTRLLLDVILPNLKAVQATQLNQIAANDRLEQAIEELRLHLDAQFAHLSAQLIACRAEVAAMQAALKVARDRAQPPAARTLIH